MGFNVNFNQKPIIKESQATQDGGAGNLGYFERQEEEKKKEKEESIFSKTQGEDVFGNPKEEPEETFSISKFIAEVIFAVKEWFRKLIG